jgi:hypothetical protein
VNTYLELPLSSSCIDAHSVLPARIPSNILLADSRMFDLSTADVSMVPFDAALLTPPKYSFTTVFSEGELR